MSKYQPEQATLGAKSVAWTPSGQLLAIGGYDQKIKLLNYITYKLMLEFEHSTKLSSQDLVIIISMLLFKRLIHFFYL